MPLTKSFREFFFFFEESEKKDPKKSFFKRLALENSPDLEADGVEERRDAGLLAVARIVVELARGGDLVHAAAADASGAPLVLDLGAKVVEELEGADVAVLGVPRDHGAAAVDGDVEEVDDDALGEALVTPLGGEVHVFHEEHGLGTETRVGEEIQAEADGLSLELGDQELRVGARAEEVVRDHWDLGLDQFRVLLPGHLRQHRRDGRQVVCPRWAQV